MLKFILVFIGSGIGGSLRYTISLLFQHSQSSHKFPLATFTANAIAALLIGVFYSVAQQKQWLQAPLLLLLTTGICGGLSTFSAFSYEGVQLLQHQQYFWFTTYVVLSIVCSIGLTFLGTKIV